MRDESSGVLSYFTLSTIDLEKIMLMNSDSDNDTKVGHTRNARAFREVHIVNLFKKNYGNEGFYSGEEAYLMDK